MLKSGNLKQKAKYIPFENRQKEKEALTGEK